MRRLVPALLVTAGLAACSQSGETGTPTPTQPTTFAPPTVTDTFTGVLTVLGTDSHPYIVPVAGEVNVTLTALDPPQDVALTVSVGLPSTTTIGSCATLQSVTAHAGSTPQLKGHALAGTFCVAVTDTGNLTDNVNYTVTVAHP